MDQFDQAIRHAWLELTNKCNLECLHCYSMSGPKVQDQRPHTESFLVRQLTELHEIGCRSIQFIGGEPLASRLFADAVYWSRAIGFDYVSVYSNLVSVSEKNSAAIYDIGVNIHTSFYSHDALIHDTVVKRKGAFDKTSENISRFAASEISLDVGIIHIPGINDDLDKTKKYLESLGVVNISVDQARAFGRYEHHQQENNHAPGNCGRCADGNICISSDGKVFPCIMTRSIEVADLHEMSLKSEQFDQKLLSARKQLRNL